MLKTNRDRREKQLKIANIKEICIFQIKIEEKETKIGLKDCVFPSGHTSFYIFLIFHKNEEKKQKENLENSELQNGNLSYTYIKSSSFMFRISNSNHEKNVKIKSSTLAFSF